MQLVQLSFNLKSLEQRQLAFFVFFNFFQVMRGKDFHKITRGFVSLFAVHDNFGNVFGVHIAQGASDQVAFLVN